VLEPKLYWAMERRGPKEPRLIVCFETRDERDRWVAAAQETRGGIRDIRAEVLIDKKKGVTPPAKAKEAWELPAEEDLD